MPTSLDASRLHSALTPGFEVYAPGCAGHSLLFERWLREAPERSAGVRYSGVQIPTVNRFVFADLHRETRQRGIFLSAELRAAWDDGRFDYLPISYSETWRWLEQRATFDLALLQVAPPDANGRCSLGIGCDFSSAAWPRAKRVFAHINPLMPSTNGPSIALSDIDAAVESAEPLLSVDAPAADATLDVLAAAVAELIEDGSTLQLGLGRLQSALLRALRDRRRLRVHAGMVSDGLLELTDSGALDEAADAVTAGVAIGSAVLYDRVAERVRFAPVGHTHAAAVLSTIHKLQAINSALEVDLLGQVNGECIGGRQFSGVGGLPDFLRGARASSGGRAIVALPSCTSRGQSRIVGQLAPGPVSVARVDADWVVTEHGAADLRERSVDARARALIAIAAPDKREMLDQQWHALRRLL